LHLPQYYSIEQDLQQQQQQQKKEEEEEEQQQQQQYGIREMRIIHQMIPKHVLLASQHMPIDEPAQCYDGTELHHHHQQQQHDVATFADNISVHSISSSAEETTATECAAELGIESSSGAAALVVEAAATKTQTSSSADAVQGAQQDVDQTAAGTSAAATKVGDVLLSATAAAIAKTRSLMQRVQLDGICQVQPPGGADMLEVR
jgi:hypothetical protein